MKIKIVPENDNHVDNVVQYLLNKNLINVESIVDGDLRISDESGKNRVLRVVRKNGVSYLLKQIFSPRKSIQHYYISDRTQIYQLLQTDFELKALLGHILPHYFELDIKHNVLITELSSNFVSLTHYINDNYNKDQLPIAFSMLGRLLGTCHTNFAKVDPSKVLFLPKTLPFIFSLVQPGPKNIQLL